MSQTVRAAVITEPGKIELRDFPMPDLAPGAVLMKVSLSGICGTDKHTFRGESKQYGGTPREKDLTYPLICGHENVGRVADTGGVVRDSGGEILKPGDRIVHAANVECGKCFYCRNAFPYYMCENMVDYGNALHCGEAPHLFGGWSEYIYLLPNTQLFRVPDDLPDEVAVLTEVMAVTHGFELARRLNPSAFAESVAVYGVGPLGFCHLIKAKLMGCGKLIAIDLFGSRLDLASDFGATLCLNASELEPGQIVEAIRRHTGGVGPDIVLSCAGIPGTFKTSIEVVRQGGTVVEAGAFVDMGPISINPSTEICAKNINILGVGGETATSYLDVMNLMARNLDRLPFDRIVSHYRGLDEVAEALHIAQNDGAMKVVIDPNGLRAQC
jgi:threonine dehydrogenase-like Zn-dependent dehydrogenase